MDYYDAWGMLVCAVWCDSDCVDGWRLRLGRPDNPQVWGEFGWFV
ncbi:hypothetical protein [Erwinia sp. JUb26]|nr:hypothetical protein [Erwinia sp. JUb26]